jgi:type I restriction enzyme S subunit
MIDLPADQLKTVKRILKTVIPDYEIRAFGSWVAGTAKPWSDLDLLLVGNQAVEETRLCELRELFEESDLPIRVDLLDVRTLSSEFLAAINDSPSEVLMAP